MNDERTAGAAAARVGRRLAALSLEERCRLLGGASTWRTHAIERAGVPALKMSDGPNGVRGETHGSRRTPGVAVPVGIALGASWDPGLVEEIGALLGREAVRKGAHVLLAPTVNLQRTPIGGRVFECYSEDPTLTACLAVGFVRGVQSQDVAPTVKHFAANDTEIDRMSVDVAVDERVLRELYLRPFEATVRAGAWGVMSAYNRLRGEFCSANRWLLGDVLRDEWGFDGFVVSDWLGAHDTVGCAEAGLTVAMPGPATVYGEPLERAVEAGTVSEETVEALVREVLVLIERTRADERGADRAEETVDHAAERALCRRAAVAGTTLVHNTGVLPLAAGTCARVAVLGPNATATRTMGGGSANLESLPFRSILDEIAHRLDVEVVHEPGVRIDKMAPIPPASSWRTPEREEGLSVEYLDGPGPDATVLLRDVTSSSLLTFFGSAPPGIDPTQFWVRVRGTYQAAQAGEHTVGFVVTGPTSASIDGRQVVGPDDDLPRSDAFFGFGSEEQLLAVTVEPGGTIEVAATMPVVMGFGALRIGVALPDPPDLVDRAVAAAASADVAVVVVGTNEEWETEGHDRDAIELPGAQDELVARVAEVCERTVVVVNAGSPVAMPWLEAVGAVVIPFFGGMEMAPAVVDVLLGEADPGGRLPITFPQRLDDVAAMAHHAPVAGTQTYGEGYRVGYRGFVADGIEPLFWFGHGLSYGTVDWGAARLSASSMERDESVFVDVELLNVGDRVATEVVQVYVRALDPVVARSPLELAGFARASLAPGERTTVVVEVGPEALRRWDVAEGRWVVDPGTYELAMGASVGDLRHRRRLEVT